VTNSDWPHRLDRDDRLIDEKKSICPNLKFIYYITYYITIIILLYMLLYMCIYIYIYIYMLFRWHQKTTVFAHQRAADALMAGVPLANKNNRTKTIINRYDNQLDSFSLIHVVLDRTCIFLDLLPAVISTILQIQRSSTYVQERTGMRQRLIPENHSLIKEEINRGTSGEIYILRAGYVNSQER